ncbi:tRNA dihydrouridine synthase DusB [Dongshaea marina]|uniref:tRNA dihydrouridine synthase DusB n=1 Tax=Dongshaea marina TaxID=2047966 RepID=UPI000D3E93E8|nr:tRNA dihydrouridine synthase DusB [Dongshaea marina]
MQIGSLTIESPVVVAPMAGITDQPFRRLCLRMGAGLAVSEMLLANPDVWKTEKSRKRLQDDGEQDGTIRGVQIVGSDPQLVAQAVEYAQTEGAQLIDINMGCPVKKVNKKLAGSALLQFPALVEEILRAAVAASDVPVTLKIRTGWDQEHRNGVEIARLAEGCGIQALAVHGRTRSCMFRGNAEYQTIRAIKQAVSIPVIANGDIDSPEKARKVLDVTGADAVMVGRAAQGDPWLFREICHYLEHGVECAPPHEAEIASVMEEHLEALHSFYGEYKGVRIARKHIGWYLQKKKAGSDFRRQFNQLESAASQRSALNDFLSVTS